MKWNENWFAATGNSQAVVNLAVNKAEAVAAAARASAPVETGDYRDSIHVEVDNTAHRVVVHVVASSDHAMVIESKTGNLARALRSVAHG